MPREERFRLFIEFFEKNMPGAETELHHVNPYELLVATILSAQCTDKRVNMITPAFFEHFPTVASLSKASQREVYELVKSCSYPNSKSRYLIGMAIMLLEKYNGIVPSDPEQLMTLPGVGRKTAHVIAAVAFNKPVLAVDTHVFRVAARLGLTINAPTPLETERQLIKFIPRDKIPAAHHWLILHGRYICQARKPKCSLCGLTDICKFYRRLKNISIILSSHIPFLVILAGGS
ncbi:MAG: endonuclease III [Bacteroidetes bacterium]|nr:endonuclease III [Bacteroidota bacterium]